MSTEERPRNRRATFPPSTATRVVRVPSALTVNVVPRSSSSPSGSRTSSGRSPAARSTWTRRVPRWRATSSRPPEPGRLDQNAPLSAWMVARAPGAGPPTGPARPKTTIAPTSAAAVSGQSSRRAARDGALGETSERSKAASRRVRSRRTCRSSSVWSSSRPAPAASASLSSTAASRAQTAQASRCRWKLFRAEPSSRPSRKAAT